MSSNFIKRLISTVVALAFLAFIVYLGNTAVTAVCVVAGLIMLFEYNRAMGQASYISYAVALALFAAEIFDIRYFPLIALLCGVSIIYYVVADQTLDVFAKTVLSYFYIVTPILIAIAILQGYGFRYFLLALIIPIMTDMFAFVFGKLFGRTPLVPKISPNKTVEGLVGGVATATAAAVAYTHFFAGELLGYSAAIGITLGIVAQIGDLAASKIKRACGLKDYGDIIPGHGGLLDRFDSYLTVFPIFYTFLYCLTEKVL